MSDAAENSTGNGNDGLLRRTLAYHCEDGIPDIIFSAYLVFYAWHYYCMATGQAILATAVGFLIILAIISLVWVTFTFQKKKYAARGMRTPKGLHPFIIMVVVVPSLTALPLVRQFLMGHTLALLGIWVALWALLAYSTKSPRFYAYTTWAVISYWMTYLLVGAYDLDFLNHPYLVFSILCASVPLLVGSITFHRFIRDKITVCVEPSVSYSPREPTV